MIALIPKKNPIVITSKKKKMKYQKGIDEIEYYTIRATLPDIAPKSFGGYRRMKNQQTKNYLKIAKIAEGNGIKNF